MILPTKHVTTKSSILGLGGLLLHKLDRPSSISGLWERCKGVDEVASFERFVIALDFLFILGSICFQDGVIVRTP